MRIIIRNLQKKIPIDCKKTRQAALKALSEEGAKLAGEITILFINDQQIRELNLMYLGDDRPTDVIAFDNSVNKKELLADIAISTDTAIRNARVFKTSGLYEVYLYLIHGILHLLGYADNQQKQRRLMQKKAENILAGLIYVHTQNRSHSSKQA